MLDSPRGRATSTDQTPRLSPLSTPGAESSLRLQSQTYTQLNRVFLEPGKYREPGD